PGSDPSWSAAPRIQITERMGSSGATGHRAEIAPVVPDVADNMRRARPLVPRRISRRPWTHRVCRTGAMPAERSPPAPLLLHAPLEGEPAGDLAGEKERVMRFLTGAVGTFVLAGISLGHSGCATPQPAPEKQSSTTSKNFAPDPALCA